MSRSAVRSLFAAILAFAALPLCAASFTASQSGNWSSAATWGGAGVPGSGDTATINTYTVTLDVAVTVANLTLTSTLTGSQSITITSAFNWNGGTLSGSGTTTIPSGSTMTMGGGGFLDARALNIAGTLNFTSSNYFYTQNNATVTNSGTINFQGDGGIYQNGTIGSCAVTSSGTIEKTSGTGSSTLSTPFFAQSGSQFLVQSGTFNVGAVTASGATFSAGSGTTLYFNTNDTRTFDAASTINGLGTVLFASGTNTSSGTYSVTGNTNAIGGTTTIASPSTTGNVTVGGGTLTINSASSVSIPTLTMNSGTLSGTAPITFTSSAMSWSGGTIAGTGTMTIPSGTTITLNGYVAYDTRAIVNNGALNYTSSFYSYFYNGASLTNNGTITFQGDGGFYIGSASDSIVNNGTITKSGGTGTGGIQVPLTANSGSQLNVQSGTLLLGNITSTGSTLSVSSGATAQFYYTTTATFDAASTITGAGTVLFSAGTNTINAAYSISGATSITSGTTSIGTNVTSLGTLGAGGGTLTITNSTVPSITNITVGGGTLTLNIPSTISIPTLTMSSGTINGTASISLTGASMVWSGGTIGGSGALTIPAGTAIAINGYVYFDTRAITNSGSMTYSSSYYSYFYNGASLTNNGTVTFQGDGGFYIGSGSDSVINNGTITKSGGASNGGIQVPLTANSGSQLNVQSGTLQLGNVTSTGATLSVSSGATAQFYYTTTATFDAASTITGAGTIFFSAGTNTISAAYSITGATNNNGGTTTLGTSVTSLGTLTASGGSLTISAPSAPTLGSITVSGGTLTLNIPATLSIPTLTMNSGTLGGTASISVTSAAMTWTGGTIAGSGALTIPAGTAIAINGYVYFDTRAVTNGGSMTYSSNYYSYFYNGASLTNNGTVTFQGDGGFYIGSGSDSVINNGTITKSGGTFAGGIQVPLTANSGSQLNVQSGTLQLGNVTSSSATLSVSSGATVQFYYTTTSTFDAASTISGAGNVTFSAGTNTINGSYSITGLTTSNGGTTTLNSIASISAITLSGGTLTLNSAPALAVTTLTMSGGTLGGNAPINLTGTSMTWTAGTIGGSSTLAIPNGTTITVSGGLYLDGRPVTNAGTINFTANNYFYLENNAVLTNSSNIDFQGDGGLYLASPVGTTSIVNSGTIKKSGGTGGGSQITAPLTMQSGSQFLQQSGLFYLSAITATAATFTTSAGTTLNFNSSDTRTFDSATTIGGSGLTVWQSGTNTFNGTITTPVQVSGGTTAINSASTQSIPTLAMLAGTFGGSANINLTGASMSWSGGTINGSGTLSIPAGTTITIAGGMFIDARPVTNAGTMNFTSSNYIYMGNNAVLTNSGTIDFQGDGGIYINGTVGTTSIVNTNLIKKSAGTVVGQITVPLTLQSGSQLQQQSGTLYLYAVTSTGAAITVASGTSIFFISSDTRTFDAASTISGLGTTVWNSGTSTINGTITTNVTMSGGTLAINSASAQSIPVLTMTGGTFTGSANVNLTSASMTWTSGTIGGTGTLSIPNGTTITIAGVLFIDARPVSNAGSMNFTLSNYLYMMNNAVLTNGGTIDFQGDNGIYINGGVGSTSIVNNSTIKKSGGTGTGQINVPLTANSGSQLLPQSGTLYVGAVTSSGATFNPSSGATLNFATSDTRTFDAASTISGPGNVVWQSGTNTINGTYSTITTINGGTLTINSASAQTIPTLTMNGGTINGSANVAVNGAAMTWSGGTIGGIGTFTIQNTSTVSIGGVPFLDARPVTNNGTINFLASNYMYLQNGAALTNNGTIDFQGDNALYLNTGVTSFTNNGNFGKSGGTTSTISVPATNGASGTIKASSGTLNFTNGLSSTGTLSFAVAGASTFGRIIVSGAFPRAGTLTATTTNGYTPVNGTTFQVLTFGSTSGAFAQKNLLYAGGGFTDSYTSTAMTLTAGLGACYSTPSGVISWYRGEGNAVDSAGTNSASFAGGATTTSGYVGQAFSFNGTTAYVTAPDSGTLRPASITADAWIYFASLPGTLAAIVTKPFGSGVFDSYAIWYDNGGALRAEISDASGEMQVSAPWSPSTNTWYHVAFSFDSATQVETLYLNGNQVGTATYAGRQIAYDTNPFLIGGDLDNGSNQFFFPGLIDEATLYSRALTGSEIQNIYFAGATGKCFTASAPTISSFAPGNGGAGTTVTINGTNFIGASSVSFNGTPAASFVVNSATQITATVPTSMTTGPISVTTAGGTATSASNFTFICLAPNAAITAPSSVCANATNGASVTPTSGATYAWTVTNGTLVSGQGTPSITFNAGSTGNVSIAVNVTSSTGCPNSGSASVTINPLPPSTITAPSAVCPSTSANASVAATSGATYAWTITNGTITGGAGTNAISFSAAASGNVALNITVTSSAGCSTNSSAAIPINSSPAATVTVPPSVCANGSASASVASQSGATYTWTITNGTITGGAGTNAITFTAGASGNVTVNVSVTNGGCTATGNATISINAPPSPTISAPSSVCANGAANASVAAQTGATYAWTITNGTINSGQGTNAINFTAGSSGSVVLSITETLGGCSGTASQSVTTTAAPVASISGPSSVCPNTSATLDAGAGFSSYLWSNGATTQTITVPAGTYGVTVTNGGGCSANATKTVAQSAAPLANITAPSSVTPNSTNNPASVTIGPAGTTYNWTISGGTITSGQGSNAIAFTAGAGPTLTLGVTVTSNGCSTSGSATVSVGVLAADLALAMTPSQTSVNGGGAVAFTITVANNGPADANNLTLSDTFSSTPANVTATGWSCSQSATVLTCTRPLLTANTSSTITINITAPQQATTITNGASVSSATPDSNHGNNSASSSVIVNAPTCTGSGTPVALTPSNTTTSSPVTFTWQAAAQAVGYRLWISVDGGAAQDLGTTDGATSLKVDLPGGTIVWFVDALFAGCSSTRSNSLTFTVPKPAPCANSATSLVAPANNSTSNASTIQFTWTAVANASGYRLWASLDNGDFNALSTTTNTTLTRTFSFGHVVWYVETLFDGCNSIESAHNAFDITKAQNCGTAVAQLLSPDDNSTTTNANVTFNWSPVQGATTYEVWLALNNASPVLLGSTASTTLTKEVPAGVLEWFVRANFDGCDPRDSAHRHFTFTQPVSCSDAHPVLVAPLNNATTFSPVNLSWKEVAGATSYKVLISRDGGDFTTLIATQATHVDNATIQPGSIDWMVEASFGNNCAPTASSTSHFVVLPQPQGCVTPGAPAIFAPTAASSGVTYVIRWQKVAGGTSYTIQEAATADFASPTSDTITNDNASFTHTNNNSVPITYYYRVRASNECAAQPGPFSSVVAIVILPPTTLTGAIPSDQAQNVTYTIPLLSSLAGFSFTATPNEPWLTVTPSSGIIPAGGLLLSVVANTNGLPLGTSVGGITITTNPPTASSHASTKVTTNTTSTVSVSLVQPVQSKTNTAPPPDALIIPAVAHADGINSKFQSDVRVTNTAPQTMKYQVTFTPSGDNGAASAKQTTIDVDPGKTIALDDVLGTFFTSGAVGTLEVRPLTQLASNISNLLTFASSRTFNATSNGTFGQYIPAIPFANFIGNAKNPILSLQQIAQSDSYRTNLGLVEGSGNPASVLISVFGGDGKKITDFPVALTAGEHTQFSLAQHNVNVSDGRVEVKVTSSTGKVTAYASVLDNLTNDPMLVNPITITEGGGTKFVIPGVADLNNGFANWRTDTRIYNASASTVTANLLFYSQTGAAPVTKSITLAPNEVKQLDNTLASFFGVTNDGGALHITTDTPANLITSARTYNQTTNGTYGQFINGITPNDAAAAGGRALQILQVEESDRYRSNIGVAEVNGKPATVELQVVPADGRVAAKLTFDMKPNEFRQFNSLLQGLNVGTTYNARVTVRVVSGEGRIAAYASVIDALTNDPTFVPAQ